MAWYTGNLAQHPRRAMFLAKVVYYAGALVVLTIGVLIFEQILNRHDGWKRFRPHTEATP